MVPLCKGCHRMHDSYLMGLQLFLLMLLSQMAWERLIRGDPMVHVQPQLGWRDAGPGGGQQAQGPRPPLTASA